MMIDLKAITNPNHKRELNNVDKSLTSMFRFCLRGYQRGFTNIELVMVLIIFAIVSAIGLWSAQAFTSSSRLRGAISMVRNDLNSAKMNAIRDRRQCRLAFGTDNYQVQMGNSATGSTVWTNIRLRNFEEFQGVSLDSVTGNPVFHPRGTADPSSITLKNEKDKKIKITISMAGRIKVN